MLMRIAGPTTATLTIAVACLLAPPAVSGGPTPPERLKYMLNCQGCHGPHAEGVEGKVPRMKDFTGYFLHSRRGREFVIQVPGVANAPMSDADLTALVNWLLETYSAGQLPADYEPYTEQEVARLRTVRMADPIAARVSVLTELAPSIPQVREELARSAAENLNQE